MDSHLIPMMLSLLSWLIICLLFGFLTIKGDNIKAKIWNSIGFSMSLFTVYYLLGDYESIIADPLNVKLTNIESISKIYLAIYLTYYTYSQNNRLVNKVSSLEIESDDVSKQLNSLQSLCVAHLLISKTDENNNIIYANDNFVKSSGYNLSELIGQNHNILNSGNKHMWKEMYDVTAAGGIFHSDLIRNISKNGSSYYVDITVIKNLDGKGHLRMSTDITDIIQKSKDIQNKNILLTRSGYLLRHDLKNPISFVSNVFNKLNNKLDGDMKKELGITNSMILIDKGIKKLKIIYDSVYNFTILADDDREVEMQDYMMEKELTTFVGTLAFGYCVKVGDLGIIRTNLELFLSAILNYIKNSYKYNDNDYKLVEIYRVGDDIFIKDNGVGMSQKDFVKYSKPYQRGLTTKSGTGLGLSISNLIFDALGYDVSSEKLENGTLLKIIKR